MYFNVYLYIYIIYINIYIIGYKWKLEARNDVVFNDKNLLVLKDVEVICPYNIDRGDVVDVIEMCKKGNVDVFEYNSKYIKICKNTDIYSMSPFKIKNGSYVVIHKRLFKDVSDNINFNVDFECMGETTIKKSKSLFDLLQSDLGNYVSLNLIGDEYEAKYCWTIGKSLKKDKFITFNKLKNLQPKKIKYKTTQCHIDGSIQPDDYNDVFYPGDVVPAIV